MAPSLNVTPHILAAGDDPALRPSPKFYPVIHRKPEYARAADPRSLRSLSHQSFSSAAEKYTENHYDALSRRSLIRQRQSSQELPKIPARGKPVRPAGVQDRVASLPKLNPVLYL